MAQRKTIVEFPAFKVLEPTVRDGFKHISGSVKMYVDGSVRIATSLMQFAMDNNDCPIEAYKAAISDNKDVYWIHTKLATISSHKREQETLYGYNIGDKVIFLGKKFILTSAPNNNLKFTPYTESA